MFDLVNLRDRDEVVSDACPWKSSVASGGLKGTTEPLHRICPRCPDRPGFLNTISDMEERMDCNRAGRNSTGIMLVV